MTDSASNITQAGLLLRRPSTKDETRVNTFSRHTSIFRMPFVVCFSFSLLLLGCNPFAPEIDTGSETGEQLISDQMTVDGVFQNFRYAYTFKDTTIYGGLLAQEFIFSYRDYDKLVDLSWGRDEDMRITSRLFENAQNLNLVWNNIVGFSGDSLRANVSRTFNLTVTFNPSDIVRVDGRVSLDLRRSSTLQPWKMTLWKDESNF